MSEAEFRIKIIERLDAIDGGMKTVREDIQTIKDVIRRAPQPDDADVDAPVHPVDQRLLEEATEYGLRLMHPLILEHQITPKTSRYTRCSMSMLPNVSINGRIRSSGQLGRWWYSISPCRNSECVRRFTVFAFNQRS